MAQHDYDIANQSGAAFRSDLNNALDAIVTTNSGATEPATTFAFQFWADTTANQLKMRNAANDGWIVILETDGEVPAKTFTGNITMNAQTDVRFGDSDSSNFISFQAPGTVASDVTFTLPDADGSANHVLKTDGAGVLSFAAEVGGDITSTAPDRVFTNTTEEDTDGGRESKITFKGEQSGGEVSTLAQIEASHDGTSDDEKGQIVFRTNDGSDGSSPTERLRIDSSGNVGIGTTNPGHSLAVKGTGANTAVANFFGGTVGRGLVIATDNDGGTGDDTVIYNATQNSGSHVFQVDASEKARIDSSGRLLVGTSSSSVANAAIFQSNSAGSDVGVVTIASETASPADGALLGVLDFSDSGHTRAARVECARDGGTWTSGSSQPSRLVFSTTADGASSPTERMRIAQDGRCDYLTDLAFYVRSKLSSSTATAFGVRRDATTIQNGTEIFTVRTNGGIANFSANNVNLSDRNTKKDIAPLSATWDCLKQWGIVNYRYNEQPADSDLHIGVIAQEIAEVCPEVVTVFQEATEDQPEKLGVKEQQMVWMAIKALQEAQTRIETLEAKVAALEAS